MAWAFDVVSNIPRITQTGTDANLGGMATAINAVATVARSTAVAAGAILRPPTPTGLWYRCTTAGTTAATAPAYGTTEGGSTTDGTAVFNAFLAPIIRTIAGGNHYYMPSVRVQINGTLTNASPQQNTFTCFDVEMSGGNWTSGAYASDGVTPLWSGLHFAAMRQGSAGAEESDGGLRLLSGAQFTFIGGEVQVAGSIVFNSGTTPRTYGTRWRNSREFGASSARIRNKTANSIFSQIELFDIAFDLFVMPTTAPSIKARGSEYVYQYVGAPFGGIDARFVAFDLENPSGTYDFDNFGSGWVELYNCKAGAALRVVTQHPSSTFWVRYCVPLYQDLVITAKDTAGVVVQDVRFTATESPTNSPTVTFVTQGNLKTWDFRNAATYQTTTNASGVALSSPVLNVWYWQTTFKQSLRFPSSTATYQGRAYNYKTVNVSAVLGASAAIPVSAGMISLDTATTVSEATALADTGITFAPSGATGGTVTISASRTLQDVWNSYRAWISQFANRASNDTWTCVAGAMTMGAWNMVVNSGVTLSDSANVSSVATTGTITNNGLITALYTDAAGASTTFRFENITVGSSIIIYDASGITKYFQQEVTSAGDYSYYIPPGTTGTYSWAIEQYGKQRQSGSFAANTGGLLFYEPIYVEDVGLSQLTKATVAAYTAISDLDRFYDFTAYRRLSEDFIKLGQIATRSGTAVEIGDRNLVVNAAASVMESITGSTITIKSGVLAPGSKYSTIIATPPKLVTAATTEVITASIEDGAGNSSVTIQGGSGNFTLWKLANAVPEADYATGTNLGNVGNTTFRFLDAPGFKIVIVDNVTGYRITCPMDKGVYTRGLFFGSQVQLAQSAEVTQINTKVDILTNNVAALPQEILDSTVETGATVVESLRLHNSVLGGKVSGGGSATETFRDLADTKDRLVSSVTETGNRTAEVYDLT
jgi:hypothetical protein